MGAAFITRRGGGGELEFVSTKEFAGNVIYRTVEIPGNGDFIVLDDAAKIFLRISDYTIVSQFKMSNPDLITTNWQADGTTMTSTGSTGVYGYVSFYKIV